ncbi:BlaI/MecI/CopY family transcriptional regulator [Streptomyces antibioticus]|uniref:BlaI/MecI/CopY family transcriptional regulator n=1 Tax=Streptomyces antibioticus TaxID=1890 RepID=UPI0036F7861F
MSENQESTANLKPLYAARLAEDLERNTQEQEHLANEVIALNRKIEALRQNQILLLNMQRALTGTHTADDGTSSPEPPAAVPQQADDAPTGHGATPTLRHLVVSYLSEEGAPRSALEVTAALAEAHKNRPVKITVVRSTLEAMVAKGHVRRTRQGRSVYYTTTAAAAASTGSEPATA